MDKYVKLFVKKLYELYGYRICELQGNLGTVFSWCSVKVMGDFANAVVFSDIKNNIDYGTIEEKIMDFTNSSKVNINVVYIMGNEGSNEFEKFNAEGKTGIVVNKESNAIIYYNSIEESVLNEVYQCTLVFQNNRDNENTVLSVSNILIGINIIVYIITAFLSGNIFDSNINVLVFLGAKVNSLILSGEYYRLITCMFLHGGLVHIGFNMYALYSLGPFIEKIFGRKKFTIIYFFSGILSSFMSFIFSSDISIGASGAIFGLLGAALIFGLKNKNKIGKEFMMNIIVVIGINLFMGFSIPNIDNFAHMGGLIGGILCTTLFYVKK